MSEKKNIDHFLFDETLLKKYVEGDLSKDEQYALESSMSDSDFLNDAVEGLQNFKNTTNINTSVEQLNAQLKKQTQSNKRKRFRRKIKHLDSIELTVITVITLCLLGYFIIREYQKHRHQKVPTEMRG